MQSYAFLIDFLVFMELNVMKPEHLRSPFGLEIKLLVALLHAAYGEIKACILLCLVGYSGAESVVAKALEDAAIVVKGIAVCHKGPVSGQRIAQSGSVVGYYGQTVDSCLHRQHAQSLKHRGHEQIVERRQIGGECVYRRYKTGVADGRMGFVACQCLLNEGAQGAVTGYGEEETLVG